jgi:hypothetical protein
MAHDPEMEVMHARVTQLERENARLRARLERETRGCVRGSKTERGNCGGCLNWLANDETNERPATGGQLAIRTRDGYRRHQAQLQYWWDRYVPCGASFGVTPMSPTTPEGLLKTQSTQEK